MSHVFISYNRKADGDFADLLVSKLQSEGFSTWVDNDMLNAGEDWRATIDKAIREAFVLVVIMSPEAKASEYVTYEWAFAWGAGVKIIPILYKQVDFHPRLETLQYVNLSNRAFRPWDRLIKLIQQQAEEQAYLAHIEQESLYELLPRCTVRIDISKHRSIGTGFFVAPNLLLAIYHMFERIDERQVFHIGEKHVTQVPAVKSLIESEIQVFWNGQKYSAEVKELKKLDNYDDGFALIECNIALHPCVYLYEEAIPTDDFYSYGYTDNYPLGDSSTFEYEGITGALEFLKYKSGQLRPGMSGAPLLNIRTGGVCGINFITRGRDNNMGGRGMSTKTIFHAFPELKDLQRQFHQGNRRWTNCLTPQQRQKMALIQSR